MSISSINNYWTKGATVPSETGEDSSAKTTLDMNDFFSLLVAQMSNQDMYNTMDDSEFMGQMAQFSMIQAISDMSALSTTAYSVNLIGKEVTLAEYNDDGTMNSMTGIVEGVTLYNGSAQIVVDGKNYSLSSIMAVKEPNIIIPEPNIPKETEEPEEPEEPEDTDDGSDAAEGVTETEGTSQTDNTAGTENGSGAADSGSNDGNSSDSNSTDTTEGGGDVE